MTGVCHMAFTLPNFNLSVDIYDGPWAARNLRVSTVGNLAWSRRVNAFPLEATDPAITIQSPLMNLLLPAGTDIRSFITGGVGDSVEVPSGSGRWYEVVAVDDSGKGFANEHRIALISQISFYVNNGAYPGLFWPVPMP